MGKRVGERVGERVGQWVGWRVGEWVGELVGEWVILPLDRNVDPTKKRPETASITERVNLIGAENKAFLRA